MATTSITRRFVIKDRDACERLARALETAPARKPSKNLVLVATREAKHY